nr:5365_t:CDS:10 [Entrophospora candida]
MSYDKSVNFKQNSILVYDGIVLQDGLCLPFHCVKFPIPNTNVDPNTHNWDSLVDGELVYDVEPDGSYTLILLAFDMLIDKGLNITEKLLDKRLGRLFLLIKDYNKLILRNNPQFANNQPFKFAFKEMEKSYGLEKVIKETTLKLKHKSDGLIFTSAESSYKMGTNEKILKWKPPNENSIDFLLKVEHDQNKEMPRFCLFQRGNNGYEYFNDMSVTYEQWKMWIDSNEKLNERLVEVVCNPSSSSWQFLRFRDDKLQPNFSTVVDKILQSIKDGVDKETLILQSNKIRDSWKRREQERKQRIVRDERALGGEGGNDIKNQVVRRRVDNDDTNFGARSFGKTVNSITNVTISSTFHVPNVGEESEEDGALSVASVAQRTQPP